MKLIKKAVSDSMVGSLGIAVVSGLQGCAPDIPEAPSNDTQQQENLGNLEQDLQNQNYFLVIEQTETSPDKYKLAERYPTEGSTRAVLKTLDGKEKVLTNEELKKLAQAEADKVEAGTSELTREPTASSGGGLSLGEMILASAAGSLIGGMIANRLANNANAKARTNANTRPAASVSRANQRARSAPKAKSKPRSGFFGGSNNRRSNSRAGSFGG